MKILLPTIYRRKCGLENFVSLKWALILVDLILSLGLHRNSPVWFGGQENMPIHSVVSSSSLHMRLRFQWVKVCDIIIHALQLQQSPLLSICHMSSQLLSNWWIEKEFSVKKILLWSSRRSFNHISWTGGNLVVVMCRKRCFTWIQVFTL